MDHVSARLTSRPPSRDASAERPRLVIRTCKHILDTEKFCRAPAVNKRNYCHAHLRLRRCLWRMARAGHRIALVKLPPLVDAQSAQAAKLRVRAALAGGHVDREWARLMFWAVQMSAANCRYMERRPTLRTQGLASLRDRAGPFRHQRAARRGPGWIGKYLRLY